MSTQQELLSKGINKIRKTNWALPDDYLEFNILPNGKRAPWVYLYSCINQEINGKNPVELILFQVQDNENNWEPYAGKN